jgi:hypothetical protein
MKLDRRLRVLESRVLGDCVILHFADGSTREIRGPRYFLGGLVAVSSLGIHRTPLQSEQLALIRESVDAEGPGRHLVELIRILLAPPDAPATVCTVRPQLRFG